MDLFYRYLDEKRYDEAELVAQNMFNRNKGNEIIFSAYFDLLIKLATDDSRELSYRRICFEKAETVLSSFSENVEINEQIVELVKKCEECLLRILKSLQTKQEEEHQANHTAAINKNSEALSIAERLVNRLSDNIDQKTFIETLKKIEDVDSVINKDIFLPEQKSCYERISKRCASVADSQTKKYEHQRNVEYNLSAISTYERVFNLFKKADIDTSHEQLMKEFFSYDNTKLFNETLVYYNYIYSYILGKLNDDEKLLMTKLAVMTERKM